jgi:putative addiction module killer protein
MSLKSDIIDMKTYDIEIYETEDGDVPFQNWLDGIKNAEAKTQIVARIRRASMGNFGDWKPLTGATGICEMRIHHSQGFRIFYTLSGQKIVLLLAGATKKEQDKTIVKAKTYLADYERRTKT